MIAALVCVAHRGSAFAQTSAFMPTRKLSSLPVGNSGEPSGAGEGLQQQPQQYFLLKSEPDTYSITDLIGEADQSCIWEGVRNYVARNFIRR